MSQGAVIETMGVNGVEKCDAVKYQRNDGRQCRICLDQTYPMIVPCKCTGTVRYVHQECIVHWAQEILKKTLSQMQQDQDYQQLASIDCELCKERVRLRVQWTDVKMSLKEAKQSNTDCFWATFIVNVVIGLMCLGCICFALAILVLVLTQSPVIDYQRFRNTPFATWLILTAAFVIGFIFLIRSIKQIISIFYRKQFRIKGVLYKQIVNEDGKELDVHNVDDLKLKSINEYQISIQHIKNKKMKIGLSNQTFHINIQIAINNLTLNQQLRIQNRDQKQQIMQQLD